MAEDLDGSRAVFWVSLKEHIAALSAVEAKICSSLMKGLDFEEEARGVVEKLIVCVTTEFPVCQEEEGWDENAASDLIAKAQDVSEKFLAFYELSNIMTPSDFDQVSLLRQELKQAIEVFSAAQHRTSSSDVVSPVLPPVSSIPVSSGKKGASQLPSMRRAQSSVLSRTSLTAVEDDATPVLTSKNSRPQTAAPGRSSWLARKSSVVPSAPSVQQTTSSAPSSSHPLMFSQEMEQSNIAARFYQTAAYDRANQRILFHGGLRRDKPSRLCISQIFAVDLSESRKDSIKYTWQSIEASSASGAVQGTCPVPSLCWHSSVFLDHLHWLIFGGKSSNNQMSSTSFLLDLTNMTWSIIPPLGSVPDARGGHCMHRMPDGENFVLFGGIDSSGTKCFNDVYLFERASRRWKQQPTINPPVARFVHASAVMHNHLWILGGLKGTLAKSSPCGDLWCLNLTSWEWTMVRAAGLGPEPGTYVMAALEGENGSELICVGSKAFEDTRHFYHLLSVPDDDPSQAIWSRGQFPAKYKLNVSEGMSCIVGLSQLFVLGGRPGDSDKDYVDFQVIPRDVFVAEKRSTLGPIPGSPKVGARKSLGASASSSSVSKRPPVMSKTVSSRAAPQIKDSRSIFSSSESEVFTSVRDLLSSAKPSSSKDAISPESLSPRASDETETLSQFHQVFELEVSRRLELESKVQSFAQEISALKEAYALLQTETQRLYQLAMSEVTTPAGREKLERRYDELRSASSEILVNEPVKVSKEKSFFSAAVATSKGQSKKDKLLDYHVGCVEKINAEANKLLRPIAAAAAAAATTTSAATTPSTGISGSGSASGSSSSIQIVTPEGSGPVAVQKPVITKALPVPKRKENSVTSPIISPRDSEEGPSSPPLQASSPGKSAEVPALPANLHDIWDSPELSAEFEVYVRHEYPEHFANFLFCQGLCRVMAAPQKTQVHLIEALVADHLVSDAELVVTALDSDMREAMVADSSSRWIDSPPHESYWNTVLGLVEVVLRPVYSSYLALAGQSVDKRRQHMSLSRRPGGSSGHHQLVATAETQLMERLAEMGKEGNAGASAAEPGEAKDEQLFKKVTSEMVATEINYVTDLKVTTTIFRRPLTEEKSAILPLEAFNIFANIEDVYALNRKFLTVLQKEHGKPLSSKNYGKVFLEFAPQFQKVYLAFAGRKTISRNTLDQLVSSNKKFVAFLEECLQKPPCRRLELKSFLIKPVQRICKYPLLLRTMVESCPSSYSDKASLIEAKKKMEEVVMALEDQLFVEDDKMKVLELEGALNWHRDPKLTLAVEGRSMIYDSVLIVSEVQLGASLEDAMMKNMRNVHLYLMTDIMLLVERVEKKGVRRDFLYQVISVPYSHVVPMTGKAAFQVLQPQQDKKYIFRCVSMEQKLLWQRLIQDAATKARGTPGSSQPPQLQLQPTQIPSSTSSQNLSVIEEDN